MVDLIQKKKEYGGTVSYSPKEQSVLETSLHHHLFDSKIGKTACTAQDSRIIFPYFRFY